MGLESRISDTDDDDDVSTESGDARRPHVITQKTIPLKFRAEYNITEYRPCLVKTSPKGRSKREVLVWFEMCTYTPEKYIHTCMQPGVGE